MATKRECFIILVTGIELYAQSIKEEMEENFFNSSEDNKPTKSAGTRPEPV